MSFGHVGCRHCPVRNMNMKLKEKSNGCIVTVTTCTYESI